eukprot:15476511-Alexandrium_andersonii.AAC.1
MVLSSGNGRLSSLSLQRSNGWGRRIAGQGCLGGTLGAAGARGGTAQGQGGVSAPQAYQSMEVVCKKHSVLISDLAV